MVIGATARGDPIDLRGDPIVARGDPLDSAWRAAQQCVTIRSTVRDDPVAAPGDALDARGDRRRGRHDLAGRATRTLLNRKNPSS